MNLIHRPPLPTLSRTDFWWNGMDTFPAWQSLQVQEPYGVDLGERPFDGRVAVQVITEHPFYRPKPFAAPGSERFPEPFSNQLRAYAFLKGNVESVTDAVLRTILKDYPSIKEEYEEAIGAPPMPHIDSVAGLQKLIGIGNVWILPLTKDGIAYLGLDFGCAWDTEHGLGVVTHRERVLSVGQAETAAIIDAAFEDGGEFQPH